MTDPATTIRRDPRVLWRATSGCVLLVPVGGEVTELGGSGVELWHLLGTERTTEELVDRLARHFTADPEGIRADVARTLDRLAEIGAIEVSDRG